MAGIECEVLPNRPKACEIFLSAFGVSKAADATFAFTRRLVAVNALAVSRTVAAVGEHLAQAGI